MNNFIDLLKRAGSLWWRVKLLWPLGMLAALVGYGDSAISGNFNSAQNLRSDTGSGGMPLWLTELAASPLVRDVMHNPWPYLLGLLALLVGWALLAAMVGALAHGALIRVADVADQGYTANLSDGLRVGAARALPLFLLNLILALPVIIIMSLVLGGFALIFVRSVTSFSAFDGATPSGPLIASLFGAIFCLIGVFLLLALLAALLGLWARVAQRACVVEGLGPVASLGRGWHLMRRNLGLTLLTWLFQALLGGVIGFVLALPALALSFPLIFAVSEGRANVVGLFIALIGYAFVASVVGGGILTAFNATLWTVIYRAFCARETSGE